MLEVPSSCSSGGAPYGHGNVADMAGWLEQGVHPLQLRVDGDGEDGDDNNVLHLPAFTGPFCPVTWRDAGTLGECSVFHPPNTSYLKYIRLIEIFF